MGSAGRLSAPIWQRFMLAALKGVPIKGFPYAPPPKVRTTKVPNVVGKTPQAAESILTGAKLG
jgi:membrane carboxypeptidase/penicillin-binding protein